jgi:antitoxin component YwqK of YwqJK toxin-antitoxin module
LHDNGQKEAKINYKVNIENGLSISWYKNGQKSMETTLKDGQPDGFVLTLRLHSKLKALSMPVMSLSNGMS